MHPDCLICLEKVKRRWSPPTKCACEIIIHEKCWDTWEKRAGPRCIICRKGIRVLLIPPEEEREAPEPVRDMGKPCLKVASVMIVFILTWLFMQMMTPKPFVLPERNWRRIEL
jgi:hypothetical protein